MSQANYLGLGTPIYKPKSLPILLLDFMMGRNLNWPFATAHVFEPFVVYSQRY